MAGNRNFKFFYRHGELTLILYPKTWNSTPTIKLCIICQEKRWDESELSNGNQAGTKMVDDFRFSTTLDRKNWLINL